MRELVIHLHFAHLRCVGCEDMPRDIDDEVHDDWLLMAFLPVFVDLLLILLQFVHSSAQEQTRYVVIIVWRGKSLDGRQVFFYPRKLLLGGHSLVFVDGR